MSEKLVVVGSASDAARNWHLSAGAILSARGVGKFTPKSRPSEDGQGGAKSQSKRDNA